MDRRAERAGAGGVGGVRIFRRWRRPRSGRRVDSRRRADRRRGAGRDAGDRGTGEEQPQENSGGVAINVAGLPVGGQADDSATRSQCVRLAWLGRDDSELPAGFTVTVTEAQPDREGFEVDDFSCPLPSCLQFVFRSSREACHVALTVRAPLGAQAKLSFKGTVGCPAGKRWACEQFADRLDDRKIDVYAPDEEPSPYESPAP